MPVDAETGLRVEPGTPGAVLKSGREIGSEWLPPAAARAERGGRAACPRCTLAKHHLWLLNTALLACPAAERGIGADPSGHGKRGAEKKRKATEEAAHGSAALQAVLARCDASARLHSDATKRAQPGADAPSHMFKRRWWINGENSPVPLFQELRRAFQVRAG